MGADEHADKELTDSKNPLSRASRMKNLLKTQFAPAMLELVDESSRHAGHAGAAPGGETHFHLKLVSTVFEGRSRLDRQRLVNAALGEEFNTGLHALSLDLKTPAEI
jgi:BolA family transcriptional regulator, general stress-responsive regulator